MIHLVYSHRTEELLERLCDAVEQQRAGHPVLTPVDVVVPNGNMERHVEFALAQAHGVAANLRFRRLERFARDWFAGVLPNVHVLDADTLQGMVFGLLVDGATLDAPALEPVKMWLMAGGADPASRAQRCVQLSQQLSHLLLEYSLGRPDMLRAWEEGRLVLQDSSAARVEKWQAHLWLRVRERSARIHQQRGATLWEAARLAQGRRPAQQASSVFVFGLSYMARAFQDLLGMLGRTLDVHLYVLNPCVEFWEDVESVPELRGRLKRLKAAGRGQAELVWDGDDPWGVLQDAETPALRLWGRPGREHLKMLNALTDGNMDGPDVLTTTKNATLLQRLQHDIATRHPDRGLTPETDARLDGSLEVVACPSVQRELEAVAERIWQHVEDNALARTQGDVEPLRFQDMAVLVNAAERDRYFPLISAVFSSAQKLPHHLVDLALWQTSPVLDAARVLLELPRSSWKREAVMEVLTHPAVLAGTEHINRGSWLELVQRLGIFEERTHRDQADTYVNRDVFNWDQGIRRVAWGSAMAGQTSGDERLFALGQERYPVEEARDDRDGAEVFGLAVRSLMADASTLQHQRSTLAQWSQSLAAYLAAYLHPPTPEDERDVRRVMAAVHALAALPTQDTRVDLHTAVDWLLGGFRTLSGSRGEYLADGVVVSTLMPMRAIPFKHVFMVGMNQGTFPAVERRDQLDLRAVRRAAGDVTPTERDRYTFLETLMCTRETLCISHQGRDDQTGESLSASSTVQELMDMVAHNQGVPASALLNVVPVEPTARAHHRVFAHARQEALADGWGQHIRTLLGRADVGHLTPEVTHVLAEHPAARPLADLFPTIPAGNHAPRPVGRMGLSALRRFLQCPMQTWARVVLGLGEDESEAENMPRGEPLEPNQRDAVPLLRRCFIDARGSAERAFAAYTEALVRLQSQGAWPVGVFTERSAQGHRQTLRLWEQAVSGSGEKPHWECLRFGPAPEREESTRVHPPLKVRMENGATVDLMGTTEVLLPQLRGSLVLLTGNPSRDDQLKHHLRGFVDLMVLSAAGMQPAKLYASRLVTEGSKDSVLTFRAPGQPEALEWISSVVTELVQGTHAFFFPSDAVLVTARKEQEDTITVDMPEVSAVDDALREMKAKGHAGESEWGPVPTPHLRPAPDPATLARWMHTRWRPFFELMQNLVWGGA